jgi:hypothetical protein
MLSGPNLAIVVGNAQVPLGGDRAELGARDGRPRRGWLCASTPGPRAQRRSVPTPSHGAAPPILLPIPLPPTPHPPPPAPAQPDLVKWLEQHQDEASPLPGKRRLLRAAAHEARGILEGLAYFGLA